MTNDSHDQKSSGYDYDIVIVGAGFAGLYMLHRAKRLGLTAKVIEKGDGVGGTWYWNRYPGARCDVPSFEYSYEFDKGLQQDWDWTERYAKQEDILAYLNHVADRFGLWENIQLETAVTGARYDEANAAWEVGTDRQEEPIRSHYLVLATGCLSAWTVPDIEGIDSFEGTTVHTADWPKEGLDVSGKRVGVIGTGSSGIQVAPELAKNAKQLYVLQRTPAFSVPSQNRPLAPEERDEIRANYDEFRAEARSNRSGIRYVLGDKKAYDVDEQERERVYDERWAIGGLGFTGGFKDLFDDVEANETAGDYVRRKIRKIVKDPETAEKLIPDTLIGCKRLCVDNGYFEMFNRDNVSLVALREEPLHRITPKGVQVGDREIELDVIVFATGFDAMTGSFTRLNPKGVGGRTLQEKWSEGPKTYLGIAVHGFPNMFLVTGPGSPSVLSNMVKSIGQHVEWISDCVEYLERNDCAEIDATEQAEENWVAHVNEVADKTIYPLADSWYVGTNIPGKARVFMPYIGVPEYTQKCNEVAEANYEGFEVRGAEEGKTKKLA